MVKPIGGDEYHDDNIEYINDDNRFWSYEVRGMELDDLRDFYVEMQVQHGGKWRTVAKYTREGDKIFLEEFGRSGRNSLQGRREFAEIDDADRAHDVAIADMLGNWRDRLRRYRDG